MHSAKCHKQMEINLKFSFTFDLIIIITCIQYVTDESTTD